MLHEARDRACSFGTDAERYDRARSSYPAALVDDLMAERPRRVIDIGCGTGKASRLFLERSCTVLGVEPDPAMAAVARRHGVAVEVARFEDWNAKNRVFDLAISGQAWHWVEPEAGYAKAGAVLRPGGRLAAFWNLEYFDQDMRSALRAVYERLAPRLIDGSIPGGTAGMLGTASDKSVDVDVAALRASGLFERVNARLYGWSADYSTAEWVDRTSTHSDHSLLSEEDRARVLAAVAGAIEAAGGTISVRFETALVTGVKKARGSPSSPSS